MSEEDLAALLMAALGFVLFVSIGRIARVFRSGDIVRYDNLLLLAILAVELVDSYHHW